MPTLSLIQLLLNGIQLTGIIKMQDVRPLPLVRTVIDPVITLLRRRWPALLENLFRGLAYILIVSDGRIATGNGSGLRNPCPVLRGGLARS